jgi:hypothetical protein
MIIRVVPAKAGTQGFQPLALGPRFRGNDEFMRSEDFLTASSFRRDDDSGLRSDEICYHHWPCHRPMDRVSRSER